MCTNAPAPRSRKWAAAARATLKDPLRWTSMTASQSSSVILWKMASRRIPALLTTPSRPPKSRSAWATRRSADAKSATESKLATASPPASRISPATSRAGARSPPSPFSVPPRSFTTTLAPCRAARSETSRPIPRPAPVTRTTLPSSIRSRMDSFSVVAQGAAPGRVRRPRPRRQWVRVRVEKRTGRIRVVRVSPSSSLVTSTRVCSSNGPRGSTRRPPGRS